MLGDFYIKLDGKFIPNPETNTVGYTDIEQTGVSEGGKDLVIVTRLQKRTWNLTFNVSKSWLTELKRIGKLPQTTMVYQGESIPVRFRLTGDDLIKGSEYSRKSNGYYTVSATVTEI